MSEGKEDLLTAEEAASYLRVSVRTVTKLLQEGKMPGRKVGRAWRIRRDAVEAYVNGAPVEGEKGGLAPALV